MSYRLPAVGWDRLALITLFASCVSFNLCYPFAVDRITGKESMKIKATVIEMEGSPEEIASNSVFRELAGAVGTTESTLGTQTPPQPQEGPVPDEIREIIIRTARSASVGSTFLALTEQALEWGDVAVEPQRRRTVQRPAGNYHLRVLGGARQRPIFAYVNPRRGVIELRLRPEDVPEIGALHYSHLREVRDRDPYSIAVRLDGSPEALAEAVDLARRAHDKSAG